MWNYSPGRPRGASGSEHVDQQGGFGGFNFGDSSQSQQQQQNGMHDFGMSASPLPTDHSPMTWGQQLGGEAQGQGQAGEQQDVEMEGTRPAGVGNLIAHFDSISKARKTSKGGAGTPTPFGRAINGHPSRVTSPAVDQFQSHSRVRTGSIGRPPPVRFGTMGAAGMRVTSPVAEGHNASSGASPFGATSRSSSMSTMQATSRGFGTMGNASTATPTSDMFGHDRMGGIFGNTAGTVSSPFGFGPSMGGIGTPIAGHSIDSYGSVGLTSPGINTPATPFGGFDFGAPRVTSPTESPMVDSFGNVDDLVRFGNATSFSSMNHTSMGASPPIQSPVSDNFGNMGSPPGVAPTFINSSVSTFQNVDPFKSNPHGNDHNVHQMSTAGSRGGNGFGDMNVQVKHENQVSSPAATQFGSINAVAGGNSTSQTRSSPTKDFRPPLPPRKAFLHGLQAQNQMRTQSQGHQQQTQNTESPTPNPSTPGFNIWRPPIPTTPKPVLAHNHQQQNSQPQEQPQQPNNMYFQPGPSKMDHMSAQTDGHQHQIPQQVSSPHPDFIKSEHQHAMQSPIPTTPHQEATFSIQNPASVSLRSQGGAKPTREQVPAEAWESYKPTIRQMYLEERRPLKEVIQLMAERHGFQATPKMYKTRFSQWGFVKNNTEDEVKRLLSMKFQRDAKGKVSEFVRNGRVINLGTYLKRKGVTEYDLVDFETPADLPSYVRCRTPTPPPAPGYLRSPDLLRAQETVVGNMRKAFLQCRQGEIDAAAAPAVGSGSQVSTAGWASMMLWGAGSSDLLYEANKKFEKQEAQQDQNDSMMLIDAFKQLEIDLKQQQLSPQGIKEVLLGMVHRDPGMMTALSKYLAAYSTTNFERSHPLRQIFTTLYEVQQKHGPATLSDLVWGCIPTVADELEAIYGRRHPYVARTWIDLAARYGHADADRLQKLVADLVPLRRGVESKDGAYSAEALGLRYTIVQLLHAASPDADQTKAGVLELWNTMRASGEAYKVFGEDSMWCFHDPVKVSPLNKRCKDRYRAVAELLRAHAGVTVQFYFEEEMHEMVHAEDFAAVSPRPPRKVSPITASQAAGSLGQPIATGGPMSPQDAWAAVMAGDISSFGGRGVL